MHVWKYLEPTKKAIEDAEVSDEEKKEEYIQRLMDIPLENYNKLHGKNWGVFKRQSSAGSAGTT